MMHGRMRGRAWPSGSLYLWITHAWRTPLQSVAATHDLLAWPNAWPSLRGRALVSAGGVALRATHARHSLSPVWAAPLHQMEPKRNHNGGKQCTHEPRPLADYD